MMITALLLLGPFLLVPCALGATTADPVTETGEGTPVSDGSVLAEKPDQVTRSGDNSSDAGQLLQRIRQESRLALHLDDSVASNSAIALCGLLNNLLSHGITAFASGNFGNFRLAPYQDLHHYAGNATNELPAFMDSVSHEGLCSAIATALKDLHATQTTMGAWLCHLFGEDIIDHVLAKAVRKGSLTEIPSLKHYYGMPMFNIFMKTGPFAQLTDSEFEAVQKSVFSNQHMLGVLYAYRCSISPVDPESVGKEFWIESTHHDRHDAEQYVQNATAFIKKNLDITRSAIDYCLKYECSECHFKDPKIPTAFLTSLLPSSSSQ